MIRYRRINRSTHPVGRDIWGWLGFSELIYLYATAVLQSCPEWKLQSYMGALPDSRRPFAHPVEFQNFGHSVGNGFKRLLSKVRHRRNYLVRWRAAFSHHPLCWIRTPFNLSAKSEILFEKDRKGCLFVFYEWSHYPKRTLIACGRRLEWNLWNTLGPQSSCGVSSPARKVQKPEK